MKDMGSTKETSQLLGIGASTLRKYAAALEEKGYVFQRTATQSRLYSATDIQNIKYIVKELRQCNRTLSEAVRVVMSNFENQHVEMSNNPSTSELYFGPAEANAVQLLEKRVIALERRQEQWLQMTACLQKQETDAAELVKPKTEELQPQYITHFRTYQGRKRKYRNTIFIHLFNKLCSKRKEA